MSIGTMLAALYSCAKNLVAFCTGKDHAFGLSKNLLSIHVVQLNVQGPALSRQHLSATFMRTAIVIFVSDVILLPQAFRVDARRERIHR